MMKSSAKTEKTNKLITRAETNPEVVELRAEPMFWSELSLICRLKMPCSKGASIFDDSLQPWVGLLLWKGIVEGGRDVGVLLLK
jgi:hypothetical protein